MNRPQTAAHYEPPPTDVTPPRRRARRPGVEAIAGWSARHRKTAIFGWLALVAVAYLIGQLLGSPACRKTTSVRPARPSRPCSASAWRPRRPRKC